MSDTPSRRNHPRLDDVSNADAGAGRRPLEGVRVLAVEQMAALPYATQLLARLGADVVKVEHPTAGESGRASVPFIEDPYGRRVGATFLRNNLSKKSVGIDLKSPEGLELVRTLAGRFDVFCENFKAGTADRLGLGFADLNERFPALIYLSVSGFGHDRASPYVDRAAYASIVEGMSGIYEYKRRDGRPPTANPVGALGDISSALFGVIGVLTALRHRDHTGEGQRVDVAMLDATIAMTDIVANFYSMGIANEEESGVGIVETFAAGEGHFVLQVVRRHHFETLARLTGNDAWLDDPSLSDQGGWHRNLDSVLRPGIEAWAASMSHRDAVAALSDAGLAAGESNTSRDLVEDEHPVVRRMLVAFDPPRGEDAVLIPGNPVKLSRMADGPESRPPWLGEHTREVLGTELGLDEAALDGLRERGVIGELPNGDTERKR